MITKTKRAEPNPDGTPHFIYDYTCTWDECSHGPDGECAGGMLLTGPISGSLVLKDGSAYSVSPECIEVRPGHQGPILHHIERMHEAAGLQVPDPTDTEHLVKKTMDFKHVCTESCGAEADQ